MKALIVFASKHGFTEKVAGMLRDKLLREVPREVSGEIIREVSVFDLKKHKPSDIEEYDVVIIGGSIYVGKIQAEITQFCKENLDTLIKKKIGLFISCGFQEKSEEQLKTVFPEELYRHAVATGYFGYGFNYSKMKFIERTITKMLTKKKESECQIFAENIQQFANQLKSAE